MDLGLCITLRKSQNELLLKQAIQAIPVVKNPPASARGIRNVGSVLDWEDPPGAGHGNSLQ